MKKTVNLLTLSVFMVSNILTPLTNFIYATETETVEEIDDVAVVRDVIGEETPDNSLDETPELSPEETDNDSIGEAGTPDEEEEQSGEINYPEVQPEAQAGEGSQEGEQVDGTSSESSESHNSAVTPSDNTEGETVTEAENQDSQTEERNVMEDEDRDITGVCQGNQDYNEDLDICYTLQAMSNVPVYYGTDMDSTHKYNGNPIGTITIKLDDKRTITMMDMNLGATTSGTSSSAYGQLYQWGNNAGVRSATVNTNSTKYKLYAPGNWFYSPILRGQTYSSSYSSIIWDDPIAHDNLWGGEGDRSDRSLIKGGKMRQGPCPDGYHIPSAGEWSAVLTYWYNTKNSANMSYSSLFTSSNGINTSEFSSAFKLPLAGYRVPGGSTYSNQGYYWTSTPGQINNNYYSYAINLYMGSSTTYMSYSYRSKANSLRCFKDSSDDIVHTVTFDTNGGYWKIEDKDSIDLYVLDGKTVTMPPYPTHETLGLYFAGWTEDPDSTDYFDWNTPITEDITLYAKYEGEPQSGEKYIEELGAYATRDTTNTVYYRQDNGIGAISIKVPGVDTFITMMDRNLGATSNNINDTDSYGDYYQWGNNYGFTNGTINKTTTQVPYRNYRPGNPYIGNQFVYTNGTYSSIANYWENDNFYDVLRGGKGDKSTDSVDTYYGGIKNGKTRQGPCPDGYHVPSMGEWNLIYKYWNNLNSFPAKQYTTTVSSAPANDFATVFKLPLAGKYWTGGTLENQGSNGFYHTSSYGGAGGYGKTRQYYHFNITTSTVNMQFGQVDSAADGFSVRCFKDSPDAIVHTVTFHDSDKRILGSDSGELDQLVADGQTLQEPVVQEGSKTLLGWTKTLNGTDYFDFSESVEEDMDLYAKWKDFEFDDLELYFLQNDGTLSHYTIMDRNMRATETYNQNLNNSNSYGYYYQWGDGPSSADDAWGGAGDSYNGNGDGTLIGNDNDWSILSGKQGVCPEGYYIPSRYDWSTLINAWKISTSTQYEGRYGGKFASDLLLPFAGYYSYYSNSYSYSSNNGSYWTSTPSSQNYAHYYGFYSSNVYTSSSVNRSYKMPVRCAKSSPNNSDFTLHANGGMTTVIAFTGTVGNGKITALGDASSYNGVFDGWYSDENYQHKVNVGDTVPTDLYAKWSCNQGYIMEGGKCVFPGKMAILIPGEEFNLTLKTLAKGKPEQSIYSGDSLIQGFKWSDSLPDNAGNIIKISIDALSDYPVYAWFDTDGYEDGKGIIYYTSEADKIFMNPDSSTMFATMYGLTEVDVSKFDTSNVTNMNEMFAYCNSLTELDVSKFDTSNVTNMQAMFQGCSSLTELDVSDFDTSNVTNMNYMFSSCSSLTELDLSNFDTSNVTTMINMFSYSSNLTELDISNFDTSNVTNMSSMFSNCSSLTELDLSNFDTSNVTSMGYMFYYDDYYGDSSNLSTIYASDKFKTNLVSSYDSMFTGNKLLVGGQGTTYNSNYTNKTYARIDGGPTSSTPGYFTAASNITYHLDGGELRNAKHAYSPLFAFKLAIPVKEGYTFIGWTGSNGNTPEREVIVPKGTEGDLEYTAHWEINNYKIIFDTVGGDDIDPIEVEYNSSLADIELPTLEKECNDFLGWEPELPETMPAEDITLVAQWNDICSVDPQPDPAPQPTPSSGGSGGGGGKSSAIDVVKESVDNNVDTHKAADDKEGVSAEDSSKAETGESKYSEEFTEAYSFAKSNGITTKSSIQEAQMDKTLTRIQMAKMLSYYAINVLGQKPDTSKKIKFRDVSSKKDAQYDNGVTLAYQLGIMGINMKNNKFRPNDEVTRAEFVTALSRMIYGMRDGTGKMKYYEPHMARMYNEGIINETNPKMKEKRGYVMIMLMRTVQK